MKRILLTVAAALLLSAPLHAPAPAQAAGCADVDLMPSQTTVPRFNAATVCLLNLERTSRGLVPVSENAQLDAAALVHSNEMRLLSFFAHESPDGSPFQNRIINTGYLSGAKDWSIGENIAWGSWILGTPRAINTAWMNSPHHRENILDPAYREIGIGSVLGSPKLASDLSAMIVTHDFGQVDRSQPAASKKRAKKKAKRKVKRLKRKRLKRAR